MKHYVGPARYSTQNVPISASTKPIDIGFLSDTISTTIAINKRHQDAENKQIAQEQAKAEKEQAQIALQQQHDNEMANRARDAEIAAVQKQIAKSERDKEKHRAAQAKEYAAIEKDLLKQYNKHMAQQEKDFNTPWGPDSMAYFRMTKGEMKEDWSNKELVDKLNKGERIYDPWTGDYNDRP